VFHGRPDGVVDELYTPFPSVALTFMFCVPAATATGTSAKRRVSMMGMGVMRIMRRYWESAHGFEPTRAGSAYMRLASSTRA
jgi:hypothetical protein